MGIFDKWFDSQLDRRDRGKAEKKSAGIFTAEVPTMGAESVEATKMQDFKEFLQASQKLPWVDAGVRAIATAGVKPALKVFKEEKVGDEVKKIEVQGENINKRIQYPNNEYSSLYLRYQTISNLALVGNAFWHLVGADKSGPISIDNPPLEIWWMKPNQVAIKEDKSGNRLVDHYVYKQTDGKNKELRPDQVIHFQIPNPLSYFKGQSPMEAIKNAAILEFYAVTYNKKFMENDAVPGMIFSTDQETTKEQGEKFVRDWEKKHKGPKKTNKVDFMWGGLKPLPIQKTPQEIQYPELKKMCREEELAVLGVQPSIVGLLEYANYSNMEVQQKKFWMDTIIPLLTIFLDQLNLKFAPLFSEDYLFAFDYSNIESLQADEKIRSEVAGMLIEHGIKTPNQIRDEMYNEEPYEGGDKYWMKFGLIEIGADSGGKGNAKALPEKKEEEAEDRNLSYWQDPTRKKLLWKNFVKRVEAKEGAFADKAKEYLEVQADKAKEGILKVNDISEVSPDRVLDEDEQNQAYLKKFKLRYMNFFAEAGEAGYLATQGKLYDPDLKQIFKDDEGFNMLPEYEAEIEKLILESGAKINKHTLRRIADMVQEGIREKWTVKELADNVHKKLGGLSPGRSRTIARTETAKVENYGQLEGYKQSEFVELKGWLCSFVPDSRESHQQADIEYSNDPILLNEPFRVGGTEMQYPGGSGVPEEDINCLCSTYPEVGKI